MQFSNSYPLKHRDSLCTGFSNQRCEIALQRWQIILSPFTSGLKLFPHVLVGDALVEIHFFKDEEFCVCENTLEFLGVWGIKEVGKHWVSFFMRWTGFLWHRLPACWSKMSRILLDIYWKYRLSRFLAAVYSYGSQFTIIFKTLFKRKDVKL